MTEVDLENEVAAAFFTSTSASAPPNESPIGQRVKAEVNDSGVQSAAMFAVENVSEELNAILNLVQITKAEVQVVAGLKYYLSAKIEFQGKGSLPNTMKHLQESHIVGSVHTCLASVEKSGKDVTIPSNDIPHFDKRMGCDFQVYDRPWVPEKFLLNYACLLEE
ncbi:cystatin-like [Heterodontus francisci]|uniref:cystatin-like n=1 Tax=Heterodontus francisci TaxID=7792 RepID=UPI00355C9A67